MNKRLNFPLRRDYAVYTLAAEGKSFYVGIGHSSQLKRSRAGDRVRYTGYLMRRERAGKSAKWSLNTKVIAKLSRAGIEVKHKILRTGLSRPRALTLELQAIRRFQSRGIVLANRQHNGRKHNGGRTLKAADVVKDIRRRREIR